MMSKFREGIAGCDRSFQLGVIVCLLIWVGHLAQAQEPPKPFQILHTPPTTREVPSAGSLMTLTVYLENSSALDTKIRLVGSRDGRFMDIAFPVGQIDLSNRPYFTIQVPAPVAAMTYHFIIHQKSGDLTLTERYVIRRNCVQNYRVSVPEQIPSAEFRRESATLLAQARSLERDAANLDASIRIIENLRKELSE